MKSLRNFLGLEVGRRMMHTPMRISMWKGGEKIVRIGAFDQSAVT